MLNGMFDVFFPRGILSYWKADFFDSFNDDILRVATDFGSRVPNISTANHFYPINGAVNRVAPDATAFAYRNEAFAPSIAGFWTDPAETETVTTWVRDYWTALHPYSSGGGYINFMDADDSARTIDNYGPNWARLREVKAKWDPDNLFHVNQNIPPAERTESDRDGDRERSDATATDRARSDSRQ
jgi:hypothetical protein